MKHFYKQFLFFLCSAAPLIGLPVGNPSQASMLREGVVWPGICDDSCVPLIESWSLRVGFYGDYVANRHLKQSERERQNIVQQTRIVTNATYLSLNFYDWVDLFTTLGATNFYINTDFNSFTPVESNNIATFRVESTTGFSWSVGSRATLWEWGCTSLGGEVQYICANLRLRKAVIFEAGQSFPDSDFVYREWQVGLGISHRIQMVVPYIAVKWSGVQVDFNRTSYIELPFNILMVMYNLENARTTGWALGVSFIGCKSIDFTLEGRFADERALYVNGQIRF